MSNLVVSVDPTEVLARESGFKKGDVILSVANNYFDDLNELRMFLAGFNWGDEVQFKVLRSGEVVTLILTFKPELVVRKEENKENEI